MKFQRLVISFCLFAIALLSQCKLVLALNNGFEMSPLQESSITANLNFSPIVDEPERKPIQHFAVREDGTIVIGTSTAENKTICVYKDGIFQYGFCFACNGDFGLEWARDKINIYFVRGGLSVEIDKYGKILSAFEIADTSENNAYWHNEIFATTHCIGDTKYTLRNDMGVLNAVTSSYTQLVATTADGSETLLYDVNSKTLTTTVIWCIISATGVGIVIYGITREFTKVKRQKVQ